MREITVLTVLEMDIEEKQQFAKKEKEKCKCGIHTRGKKKSKVHHLQKKVHEEGA